MKKDKITKSLLRRLVFENGGKQIIAILEKEKTETVNNIAERAKLKQSNTSYLLNIFYTLNIVHRKKKGRSVAYSLNKGFYTKLVEAYTQIEINEKEAIDQLFKNIDTREKDPLVYKQSR